MVEGEHSPATERGVAALRRWLGDGALLLKPSRPRQGEVVSFEYALPSDYVGVARTVRIAFPSTFPEAALRISIDPSPWLEWPHAMRDGLCLFGLRQRPQYGSPEEIVDDCLRRLRKLISLVMPDGDAVIRQREFDDEIVSYWSQQTRRTYDQLMLLRCPAGATPLFVLSDTRPLRGTFRSRVLLAEDKSALTHHWKRLTGDNRPVRAPAAAAFYLPLVSVPPVKVPMSNSLAPWLKAHVATADFDALVDWEAASSGLSIRWIVLRLPGDEPASHCVLGLRAAAVKRSGGVTYGRRAARRGTHRGSAPARLHELEQPEVHVLDRAQVHSRDAGGHSNTLGNARVVVVGVGSLGSSVATVMARAGVGNLWLVDPERLEDANLGRHALGVDDLGEFKSDALSERLMRDVPTVKVSSIHDHAQTAIAKQRDVFDQADLVISTSADWPCESALWTAKADGARWIFLQSWSEPHAKVGHALLAPSGRIDGRALFDASGRFLFRMSEWPDEGIRALPGCGSTFIPAGPAALASIADMVAQAALAALAQPPDVPVWYTIISSPSSIQSAGGSYSGPLLAADVMQLGLARQWPNALSEGA